MSVGKNFDDRAQWFHQRIYGGLKGELRLNALWGDMQNHIPGITGGEHLDAWDAGGGLGQMSLKLGTLGHKVLLSDISGEMLALASEEIERQGVQSIAVQQASIQKQSLSGQVYDLIVCHAVLEWLSNPRETLGALLQCLKPGAYLSLAVYNINAAIMMNVLKGNFKKALSGDFAGHPGSLTPPFPQNPHEVQGWLEQEGMELVCRAGVRVAYDYLNRDLKAQRSEEDVLAVESYLREQQAFWALGRYVHFIARKPE